MRGPLGLLAVLASCALLACGDDDDSSDSAPAPAAESAPTTVVADGCSESHPRRVSEPPDLTGYVVLCDAAGGRSMTIENISGIAVIAATPDGQSWSSQDVTKAPTPTFAQKVTLDVVEPGCDGTTCTVPAGTTLEVDADVPVHALLDMRFGDTASALLASALVEQVNSRLGTKGQRLADQAVTCGSEAAQLLTTQASWEEALRHALDGAPSCTSVARALDEGDPAARPSTLRSITQEARTIAGKSIDDLLLLAAKVAAPG